MYVAIGQGSFSDGMPLGISGTFNFMIVFQAEHNICQIIYSCRSKMGNKDKLIEALRRASYKFAGRQNIVVSSKWGFTPYLRDEYSRLKALDRFIDQGNHVMLKNGHGLIAEAGVDNAFVRFDA
jgi:large subunit ribosomal protein L10e